MHFWVVVRSVNEGIKQQTYEGGKMKEVQQKS